MRMVECPSIAVAVEQVGMPDGPSPRPLQGGWQGVRCADWAGRLQQWRQELG